jgi:hypothetical protein
MTDKTPQADNGQEAKVEVSISGAAAQDLRDLVDQLKRDGIDDGQLAR